MSLYHRRQFNLIFLNTVALTPHSSLDLLPYICSPVEN